VIGTYRSTVRANSEPVCIDHPGTTLAEKAHAIVNTSLAGQITPSEAAILLQALGTKARVIEPEELMARIVVLEEN
jgi:hypothetical protein